MKQAINVLRAQNDLLACHPNANLYAHLAQFVELDGYYLESEPCLVCNNPEVPFTSMKISSVKVRIQKLQYLLLKFNKSIIFITKKKLILLNRLIQNTRQLHKL